MPFAINQRVFCVEPQGNLVLNREYVIQGIAESGAIRPQGFQTFFRASRFAELEAPVAVIEEEPEIIVENPTPWEESDFEGCCQAQTIFFENIPPNKAALDRINETYSSRSLFAVLDATQKAASHDLMIAAGWHQTGEWLNTSDRVLTAYMKINRPLTPVAEIDRTFA